MKSTIRKTTSIRIRVSELSPLTPELNKEFLDQEVTSMAKAAVLGYDGWGSRYKKGPRKGRKRRLYKLDIVKVRDIIKFLQKYIHKCVWNSQHKPNPELVSFIETEIWRLLREEGSKNFVNLFKLRCMNCCTSFANYQIQSKDRNINISAISYYTQITSSSSGEDDLFLLDFLKDTNFGQIQDELILLSDKERKLLNTFIYTAKKREKKEYYKNHEKELLKIVNKIID